MAYRGASLLRYLCRGFNLSDHRLAISCSSALIVSYSGARQVYVTTQQRRLARYRAKLRKYRCEPLQGVVD